MPIGIVINPTSGKGHGKSVGEAVLRELDSQKIDYINLSGENLAQAKQHVKAAVSAKKISGLFVVGGDGMVHMAVNACVNTDIPVGVIPAGTGNDSARALGLPHKDGVEALKIGLANLKSPRRIDTIRATSSIGEFHCFATLAAGFDSLVAGRANKMKFPKGPSRYQIAMVLELIKFKGLRFKAEVDGVKREIEAVLCTAANAHVYGGGMLIVPDAKLDDGMLDLFIVNQLPKLELLRLFPRVFTGQHVTHPKVEIVRGKSFKLDSGPMPVYAEGEEVGIGPVTATVNPMSLLVFAPAA
ncbi:MAG: diacylglycerol/lipid kinase family protein [Micrococcales bacterium]